MPGYELSCCAYCAGKYARVGTMTAKESVKKRMESEEGISYTEFTYQLLQGYDFVHMCREMGVRVQVGGIMHCIMSAS